MRVEQGCLLPLSKDHDQKGPILFGRPGVVLFAGPGFVHLPFRGEKALYILTLDRRDNRPMAGRTAKK